MQRRRGGPDRGLRRAAGSDRALNGRLSLLYPEADFAAIHLRGNLRLLAVHPGSWRFIFLVDPTVVLASLAQIGITVPQVVPNVVAAAIWEAAKLLAHRLRHPTPRARDTIDHAIDRFSTDPTIKVIRAKNAEGETIYMRRE